MDTKRSDELFARALEVLPGGVNSPVRAFKAVGGRPLFIERGEGAYGQDVDGNRFVDYVLSWGPVILGHAAPGAVQAVAAAAAEGPGRRGPCPEAGEAGGSTGSGRGCPLRQLS